MAIQQHSMQHSTNTATLADVLERVLDKGIIIAGDIKIKLVDIELLTIQLRLLICSVDKAKEMGIDWWSTSPFLTGEQEKLRLDDISKRLDALEGRTA